MSSSKFKKFYWDIGYSRGKGDKDTGKYNKLEKVYESDSLRKIKVFEINYSKIND